MFGKPLAVPMNGLHVLLHAIASVIFAVFMFMGVSPTCPRYGLFAWRTIYSSTVYVEQGDFDAFMTIDLGALCWVVGLLGAIKFICLQN